MERAPALGDLFTILYRPRQTMRRILDSERDRWSVQIVLLAFLCASTNDPDVRRTGDLLSNMRLFAVLAIVALVLLSVAAAWVLALFCLSWIAAPVGRMLGGTGTVPDVRAALAWGLVPMIWSVFYRIPFAVLRTRYDVGAHQNVKEILLSFAEHGGCALIVLLLALQTIFFLWSLFVASCTLGEAQRFSTEKGFVNLAITIALPLLVIFAAVYTFGK